MRSHVQEFTGIILCSQQALEVELLFILILQKLSCRELSDLPTYQGPTGNNQESQF